MKYRKPLNMSDMLKLSVGDLPKDWYRSEDHLSETSTAKFFSGRSTEKKSLI